MPVAAVNGASIRRRPGTLTRDGAGVFLPQLNVGLAGPGEWIVLTVLPSERRVYDCVLLGGMVWQGRFGSYWSFIPEAFPACDAFNQRENWTVTFTGFFWRVPVRDTQEYGDAKISGEVTFKRDGY